MEIGLQSTFSFFSDSLGLRRRRNGRDWECWMKWPDIWGLASFETLSPRLKGFGYSDRLTWLCFDLGWKVVLSKSSLSNELLSSLLEGKEGERKWRGRGWLKGLTLFWEVLIKSLTFFDSWTGWNVMGRGWIRTGMDRGWKIDKWERKERVRGECAKNRNVTLKKNAKWTACLIHDLESALSIDLLERSAILEL